MSQREGRAEKDDASGSSSDESGALGKDESDGDSDAHGAQKKHNVNGPGEQNA